MDHLGQGELLRGGQEGTISINDVAEFHFWWREGQPLQKMGWRRTQRGKHWATWWLRQDLKVEKLPKVFGKWKCLRWKWSHSQLSLWKSTTKALSGNSGQAVAALGLKSQGECCQSDRFSLTKLEQVPLGSSVKLCLWGCSSGSLVLTWILLSRLRQERTLVILGIWPLSSLTRSTMCKCTLPQTVGRWPSALSLGWTVYLCSVLPASILRTPSVLRLPLNSVWFYLSHYYPALGFLNQQKVRASRNITRGCRSTLPFSCPRKPSGRLETCHTSRKISFNLDLKRRRQKGTLGVWVQIWVTICVINNTWAHSLAHKPGRKMKATMITETVSQGRG